MLAHLLRTDAPRHRPLPGNSEEAQVIAVLAQAHRDAVGERLRDVGKLRSLLREFFPAALTAFPNLATNAALTILAAAPTPVTAAALTRTDLTDLLATTGRGVRQSEVGRLARVFAAVQLRQPPGVEEAMGIAARALVRTIREDNAAIGDLETALAAHFDDHPDAEILRSLPGLGVVLGARVLGEFGDDRTRYANAASRCCYAGTAPVTRASGKSRVVLQRRVRNQQLGESCRWSAPRICSSVSVATDAGPAPGQQLQRIDSCWAL